MNHYTSHSVTRSLLTLSLLVPFLLMASLSGGPQNRQRAKDTGRIIGRVLERKSGEPLIGANVILSSTYFGASADVNGGFSISSIPPGIYTLTVTFIGYYKYTQANIHVKADSTVFVLVLMDEAPVFTSDDIHQAIQKQALHDADSLWEIGEPKLHSPFPITKDEAWFADRYRFRFVYDSTQSRLYRITFNGRMNELMEDRFGAIYTNQIEALWERNHPSW